MDPLKKEASDPSQHSAQLEKDARRASLSSTSTASVHREQSHGATANNNADLESGEPLGETMSRQISRVQTTISTIRQRNPVPAFQHPLTHTKTTVEAIVDFDGPDDPYRPINWPMKKKLVTTLFYGLTTMAVTFASAVFAPATLQVKEEFHVGNEVATLGTSLLLFGFGLGPLIWAPLSEVYGRKSVVLTPYFIAMIFSFATATSKDIQTVLITRFFTGFFGSAPVTNTGGVIADIWSPQQRGAAIVGYSMVLVGGPLLGPLVGGAIVQSYLKWRWTEYVTGILEAVVLIADLVMLDESYPPVLLVYKARRLRHESGNWALHARHEEWDVSLRELAQKYLVRPFQLLATPICLLVALYASFTYGILYGNLAAFPIAFEEVRGWNSVVGALPFLAVLIGTFFGMAANLFNQKYYIKCFKANNNRAVPEARLPPMMVGSVFFAAGLFIFAWTSQKQITWVASCVGALLIGFGFITIFQAAINYLIDTFSIYSASAIGANTFLRSAFAGVFPLFITPMYHALGVPWAGSIFAFCATAMIPIPYLFFIYGKRIRARGQWSRASVTD